MSANRRPWQGTRIGNITVTDETDKRKNGYMVWRCVCDCGNEVLLDTRTLQRETVRDCGCITRVKPGQKDMTGERFGRLVCLYPEETRGTTSSTLWHCRCDCGNECSVPRHQLVHGYTKSCGCLGHPPLKDYVGKKFGNLTVSRYVGKKNGLNLWDCVCDCGTKCTVGQTNLQSGKTKSCGCLAQKALLDNILPIDGTSVRSLERSLSGKLNKRNRSGRTGVAMLEDGVRWRASICFKGENIDLGTYTDRNEAINARIRGENIFRNFLNDYYSQAGAAGTSSRAS